MSETDPRKIAQEALSETLALIELVAHYDPENAASVREHITALAAPLGGLVPSAAKLDLSPRNVMHAAANAWGVAVTALWAHQTATKPDVPADDARVEQCVSDLRALSATIVLFEMRNKGKA